MSCCLSSSRCGNAIIIIQSNVENLHICTYNLVGEGQPVASPSTPSRGLVHKCISSGTPRDRVSST